MNFTKFKDKIIVTKEDFNAKHILFCGQIFSYEKFGERKYIVYSGRQKAEIIENKKSYEIKILLYF